MVTLRCPLCKNKVGVLPGSVAWCDGGGKHRQVEMVVKPKEVSNNGNKD